MKRIFNKKKLTIIITLIILIPLITIFLFKAFNRGFEAKFYTFKFIGIIDKDEEGLLKEDDISKYYSEIECELKSELNGDGDVYLIKSAYYALGAIEYLQNRNEQSVEHLKKALAYTEDNKHLEDFYKQDIRIYSALSSNYIQEGKEEEAEWFFDQAKEIALKINKKNLLCEIYYGMAKAKVVAGHNINESIDLMRKALEYTDNNTHKVRNYLYLSKLYKLSNKFDLSLEYTLNALEIAINIDDDVLINKCIISFGENYYIQKNYSKTIEIYEMFLKSNRLKNNDNILMVYGYLMECYAKVGDYINYQIYREKFLELAEKSNDIGKIIWMYTNCSELEMNFNNTKQAKVYLSKAKELYKNYSKDAPQNTDILMQYATDKILYYEDSDYNKAIKNYENILEQLKDRGIESDIKEDVLKEILNTSFKEKDYETFIKYIQFIDYGKNHEESQTLIDSIFRNVSNILNTRKIHKIEIRVFTLAIAVIIFILALINSSRKNIKINKLNKQLRELNNIDSLTKVYNRKCLNDKLKEAYENHQKISLIMIDIDFFKQYNDNYGHVNGDNALIEVATLIKNVFNDDMVFRYGGEEFCVISNKPIDELITYIEELRNELYKNNIKHEYSSISDRITLSLGIADSKLYTENDMLELTKTADKNLYKSKHEGRDRYTY